MTWRVVHVSQSKKMRLKLDNLFSAKDGTRVYGATK